MFDRVNDKTKLKAFALEFGKTIKKARKAALLTQAELAHKVNASRTTIVRIEAGDAVYMPASRVLEICEILNTDLTDIWKKINKGLN